MTFHMHEYFSSEDLDFRNITKFSLHFSHFSIFFYIFLKFLGEINHFEILAFFLDFIRILQTSLKLNKTKQKLPYPPPLSLTAGPT